MINLIKYGLTGVIASSFLVSGLNATAKQTQVQKYKENLKHYKIDYLHTHGTEDTSKINLDDSANFPAVNQHLQNVGWETLGTLIPDLIAAEEAKQNGDPTKKNPRATKVVNVDPKLATHVNGGKVPHIEVIERGTLDVVYGYSSTGKVAFINFANAIQACGGVLKGHIAQEENSSRGTSIAASLMTKHADNCYYILNRWLNSGGKWVANANEDYGSNKIIISPDVAIFNDGNGNDFPNIQWATGITAAAPNLSPRGEAKGLNKKKRDTIMLNLIRQILQSAHDEGCTIIVSGALGCGVYDHDPKTVANYFNQVLNTEGYGSYFDKVSFAILPGKDNDRSNLIAFQNVFSPSAAPIKDPIADKGNNAEAREIIKRQRAAKKAGKFTSIARPAPAVQPQKKAAPTKAVPVNNKALGGNNAEAREIIERQRKRKSGIFGGGFFN